MKRTSLRRTILLYVSLLLVGLIVAMLGYVSYQSNRFVNERIEKELQDGSVRLVAAEAQRIEGLHSAATSIAAVPQLKALLGTNDTVTIRDALSSYMAKGTDLLIALNPQGQVIARTDQPDTQPIPGLNLKRGHGIVSTDRGLYHFASTVADFSGEVLGTVIAAEKLDDAFAKSLRDLAGSDVVIVADRPIGSSLSAEKLPWRERAEWEANSDKKSHKANGSDEAYVAQSVLLGEPEGIRPLAVVLQSHDDALQPFRAIQFGLLILGIVAAAVGIAGSALLARKVTASVLKVVEGTQQVAAGNFDYRIETDSRDEIGVLAESFNSMIVGLRERADMQKFVSQSTVDMIQSSKKVSAGERVTLTILFSDMRGFTAMSENRPPEEIVRILNECLSLQAAKVKKYGGDIDKFVGDCVVALFTGEDMELKAIRCAVEIHKAIQDRNAARPDDFPIQVGVGIATGEVILGSIGSEDRLDYTVIGSHVNLCSRICSLAGPRETLMAQATYDRVEGLVAAERLEPVKVKGFKDPVPLYRMAVKATGIAPS